uniref:Solute carrier family 16 member 8 n=1 Tax=Erpetoichthys calabaricus TaxID=27687 RepID=A0A8C4SAQ5_ERPCA
MGVQVDGVSVKPPDGGWGWIVLLSCFVITGFSYAFPKAVSVYFKELMMDFHVGYSDTAWISSIMLAMLYGTGPLCSILVNKFGCRPTMLVGGLLASGGMVMASFTRNIIELYLTAGVVTGLGLALNFQPSLIMLGSYFDKRRPLANGLAAAGSPVFLSVLSPLGQVLLKTFGWRGGFLIMGGLLLNCCTCGAVMRPLETKRKRTRKKHKKQKKKLLDFTVFQNRGFIIYTVAKFITVLGLFVPTILLVNYAKDMGVPDQEAAFLLSIIGFIDIFARPTCGFFAGLQRLRPKVAYLFSFALLFNGLTDVCSAKATDYTGLVIFCVFFGISYGMVGALQFEVLMGIVGSQKFPSALGLVLLIEALAVLIGPPSAGNGKFFYSCYTSYTKTALNQITLKPHFLLQSPWCTASPLIAVKSQLHQSNSVVGSPIHLEQVEAQSFVKFKEQTIFQNCNCYYPQWNWGLSGKPMLTSDTKNSKMLVQHHFKIGVFQYFSTTSFLRNPAV